MTLYFVGNTIPNLPKKLRKGSKKIGQGYLPFWIMTMCRGIIIMQNTQLSRSPVCVTVIEGPTTERGIRDYLILLSIYQTCVYREIDFFGFLRSGEKKIDGYAGKRGR